MDRIQDIRAFEEQIADLIELYIKNGDAHFMPNSVLQIETKAMEVSIGTALEFPWVDNIDLDALIRFEDGVREPDGDAINELASKYFFVR